jgi:hypothetical protein
MRPTKYWIIVAAKDHVEIGRESSFTQANHGKAAPLRRMQPGDYIIWYSGKQTLGKPDKCQRFTAIGQVIDEPVYQVEVSSSFCPYRREVIYFPSQDVSILPLVEQLQFIGNKKSWGLVFRSGFLEISRPDFLLLASHLLVGDHALGVEHTISENG